MELLCVLRDGYWSDPVIQCRCFQQGLFPSADRTDHNCGFQVIHLLDPAIAFSHCIFCLFDKWRRYGAENLASFLPILLLHTALLGMAIGLWSSALTVKYRDLSYLIGFGMGLWMWATPIVYPLSLVPARYQFLIYINPMASVVEIFRYGFTGVGSFSLIPYLVSIGFTAILLFGGLLLFHRAEQGFIDVV